MLPDWEMTGAADAGATGTMVDRYGLASAEHLKAIGMVTAQWERLRSIVDVGISALSERQFQEGEKIISYTDLRQRLDILLEKYRR